MYRRDVNTTSNFLQVMNLSVNALMAPVNNVFRATIMDNALILPFTQYSVGVVACNVIGCSNRSEPSDPLQTDQDRKLSWH